MEYFIICFVSTTKVAENVNSSLNCYPSKQSSWWRHLSSSSSEDVFKTSSRRYDQDEHIGLTHTSSEDVFNTSWSRSIYSSWSYVFKTSSRRLQNVFKTSSRRLAKTSSRQLQEVFKTFSRRLQNVFKTSSRRLAKSCKCLHLQDAFETYHQDIPFLLTCFQDVFKTYSQRFLGGLQRRLSTQKDLPWSHFWEIMVSVQNFEEWQQFLKF